MCRVLACSLQGPRSAHRCARAKTPRRRRPRDDARNEVAPPPLPLKWTRPCLVDAEQVVVVPHAAVAGVPPPSLMRHVHGRWGHARRGSARDSSCCTLLRRAQPPRRHGRRASSRRGAAALFASVRIDADRRFPSDDWQQCSAPRGPEALNGPFSATGFSPG